MWIKYMYKDKSGYTVTNDCCDYGLICRLFPLLIDMIILFHGYPDLKETPSQRLVFQYQKEKAANL